MTTRARRVWLWWSSGKDSAWALHVLRQDPAVSVEALVTTVTPAFGRVAIHGTRVAVLEAQAAAAGVPLRRIELPRPCSNAEYEGAVGPLVATAAAAGVDAMAFGDLHLADVRAYRERMLEGSGVAPLFPIWGRDTSALAREMVAAGVEAYVASLDPSRLGRERAGARFDDAFLDSLPAAVDACGENGEFHTCVTAGPMLRRRLSARVGEVVERDGFVYADIMLDGHDGAPEGGPA